MFKTIRSQLLVIFLLFTLITSLVSGFCFLMYEKREKVAEMRAVVVDISDKIRLLSKMQHEFILYDSKNNVFYQTRQSRYISAYRRLYLDIIQDLDSLHDHDLHIMPQHRVMQLKQALHAYNQDFENLISKIQQRGFWDNGLEGAMRDYIHQIESYQSVIDMQLLLTIRRNEKDYILRKDPSYIALHSKNTALLRNKIAASRSLSSGAKEELRDLLDRYQQIFHSWIVIDKEIGTDQGGGLNEQLRNHNQYLERIIGDVLYAGNKAEKDLSEENKAILISAISVSTILSILLSFFFSNLFTRPIRLLSHSITEVVSSNFTTPIHIPSIKSKNEIATLVMSFNWMIEQVHSYIEKVRINEKKLNAHEQRFKALIENSSDGIALTDMHGKILYTSPSTLKITGFEPEELTGRNTLELVHPEDFSNTHGQFQAALDAPGKSVFIQFRLLHKDGSWRWIDGYASNFLEDPNIHAIIINYRDVTSRKNSEIKISEQYVELQRINSELDRFVYSASHDLKAPLSSILGMVSVARSEAVHPNQIQYLDMIQASTRKLLTIIKDLTNFSRNARMEVLAEKIHFEELIAESLSLYSHLDNYPYIAIHTDVQSDLEFYSDPLRIRMLLGNLVSNAIIYHTIHRQNPYIRISVTRCGDRIRLVIQDNGQGIEEDYLPRIFDMFFRASEDSMGSGLGLYIVKGIVEKLRGSVGLRTEVGQGTEFEILLPDMRETWSDKSSVHPELLAN